MKITPYGIISGLGVILVGGILPEIKKELLILLVASIFIQSLLCNECGNTYVLASYLAVIPILLILFLKDCNYIRLILAGFSIAIGLGRIGCYFAGCCTGKKCDSSFPLGITYKKGSVLVDKYTKKQSTVYPTIIAEVLINFAIGYITLYSSYGLVWYGVLSSLFMYLTGIWRMVPRMNTQFSYIPMISLLCFSALSYFKCGKITKPTKVTFEFKWIPFIIAIIVMVIFSNDWNFNTLKSLY